MNDAPRTPTLGKAWRFRWGLRTSLILVAAVGLGLGILASWHRSHSILRRRIYDVGVVSAKSEILDLVLTSSDAELLRRAARIRIDRPTFIDADLAMLCQRCNPEMLDLDSTQISDAGMVPLKGISNLRFLDLGNTLITDASIPALKALKQLKGISLRDTDITTAGIEELRRSLPNTQFWVTKK